VGMGVRYKFKLCEAIDCMDEYFINTDILSEIALESEFEIVEEKNFIDFFIECLKEDGVDGERKYRKSLKSILTNYHEDKEKEDENMEIEDSIQKKIKREEKENVETVDENLWEIFGLYKIVVFKKKRNI